MIRRPPRSTRTGTLFPYTTLFRSVRRPAGSSAPARPAHNPVRVATARRESCGQDILQPWRRKPRKPMPAETLPGALLPVLVAPIFSAQDKNHKHHQADGDAVPAERHRSEEHTSELQSLMRTSYAVFCLKK